MPTIRETSGRLRVVGLLAVLVAVVPVVALCGCGGKVDDLFEHDEIVAVEVQPNPVPTPASGSTSEFKVVLKMKSEQPSRIVILEASLDNAAGARERIGRTGVCIPSPGPCDDTTVEISCITWISTYSSDLRGLSCGNYGAINSPTGHRTWRLNVRRWTLASGESDFEDDSREFQVQIQ